MVPMLLSRLPWTALRARSLRRFVAALVAFLVAGRTDATSIRLPLKELSARSPGRARPGRTN